MRLQQHSQACPVGLVFNHPISKCNSLSTRALLQLSHTLHTGLLQLAVLHLPAEYTKTPIGVAKAKQWPDWQHQLAGTDINNEGLQHMMLHREGDVAINDTTCCCTNSATRSKCPARHSTLCSTVI
jgi:hypothetical protein